MDNEGKQLFMTVAEVGQEYQDDPAARLVLQGYEAKKDIDWRAERGELSGPEAQQAKKKLHDLVKTQYERSVQQNRENIKHQLKDKIDKWYEKKAKTAAVDQVRERDIRMRFNAMPQGQLEDLAGRYVANKAELSPDEAKILIDYVQDNRELLRINISGGPHPKTDIHIEGRPEVLNPWLNDDVISSLDREYKYYQDIQPGHFKFRSGEKPGQTMQLKFSDIFS
jgi:hypothetical protein